MQRLAPNPLMEASLRTTTGQIQRRRARGQALDTRAPVQHLSEPGRWFSSLSIAGRKVIC